MTTELSPNAERLYEFLPPTCWMKERNLAKALGIGAAKISGLKDELEAKGLIVINYLPNGGRRNPIHRITKIERKKYKNFRPYCLDEWPSLDRDSQIECYLKSGLNVIPFEPRGKRPVKGFIDADWRRLTETVRLDFFHHHKNLNVGMPVPKSLIAIDIDEKKNEWLQNERFENTLSVSTPGGFHCYFNRDPVVTTSTKVLPDIDTRAVGSFVVLPGSVHENGGRYEWAWTALPQELPIEFRREWRRADFEYRRRNRGHFQLPETIFEGERNDKLWRYGRSLKARGSTIFEIEIALTDANLNRCTQPLPASELINLIRKIEKTKDRSDFQNY